MFVRRSPAIVLGLVLSAAALATAPASASDGGTTKGGTSARTAPSPAQDGQVESAPVFAKSEPESEWNKCSEGSMVKLRTTFMSNGEIEVVGVVFSEDDDLWSWKFKHNGDFSYMGEVKAKDADRSFRIVRGMLDLSGPDVIFFRAQNEKTGEVCKVETTV